VYLVLVVLGLGLDGIGYDRLQQRRRFIDNRLAGVAEGVSGDGLLQFRHGNDIAGNRLLDRLLLLPLQLVDLADSLLHPPGGVVDRGIGVEHTRVDAEYGDLAGIRVGGCFEYKGRKRFGLARCPFFHRLCPGVDPHRLGPVERRRQVIADGVKELLHADIGGGRAAENRGKSVAHRADAQAVENLLLAQVTAFQILFGQGIVGFGNGLDHLLAQPVRLIKILGRDRNLAAIT